MAEKRSDLEAQDLKELAQLGYLFGSYEEAETFGSQLTRMVLNRDLHEFNEAIGEPFCREIAKSKDIDPWHNPLVAIEQFQAAEQRKEELALATHLGDAGFVYNGYGGAARRVMTQKRCAANEDITFQVPSTGVEAFWLGTDGMIHGGTFSSEINVADTYFMSSAVIPLSYKKLMQGKVKAATEFLKVRNAISMALDALEEHHFFSLIDAAVPNGVAKTLVAGRARSTEAGSNYLSQAVLATEDHDIDSGVTTVAFADYKAAYIHMAPHAKTGKPVSLAVVPAANKFDLASWTENSIQLFRDVSIDDFVQKGRPLKLDGAEIMGHNQYITLGVAAEAAILDGTKWYMFGDGVGYMPYESLPSGRRREIVFEQAPLKLGMHPTLQYAFYGIQSIGMVVANPYKTARIDLTSGT